MTEFLDDVLACVALDADDRRHLVAVHDVIAPDFSAIAEEFYATTGTAAHLSRQQISRLRSTLVEWMSSGLRGPYDDAFYDERCRLGQSHVEIGLAPHHVIAAMNRVRLAYHDRIRVAYPAPERHVVNRSIDKLLDIELALLLRCHQHDAATRVRSDERQRRLEQVETLKTLCTGLAHEVRNPLNSAKLQLELAGRRLRRAGDDPRLVEPIELAGHEIDRLKTLLDEFLAFARPPDLDPQLQDLVALARDIVERDRPFAERRGAELALVDASKPVVAEVDSTKIRQIIDCLVCNALEAVTAGGHVSVAVLPVDGHVRIRVADDGPGIPADVLPRIYEPFFSTKEGGTGMGMSIVHSLVGLHHGTIEVESSPRGTTFDIAVPRRSHRS